MPNQYNILHSAGYYKNVTVLLSSSGMNPGFTTNLSSIVDFSKSIIQDMELTIV